MLYQRSLEIETRLQTVLTLVRSGRYSTPMIAKQLGISIPTVSRDVTALRERGHDIRSERNRGTWRYVVAAAPSSRIQASGQHRTSKSEAVNMQYGKRGRREARIA
jgi:biotin operon repressor